MFLKFYPILFPLVFIFLMCLFGCNKGGGGNDFFPSDPPPAVNAILTLPSGAEANTPSGEIYSFDVRISGVSGSGSFSGSFGAVTGTITTAGLTLSFSALNPTGVPLEFDSIGTVSGSFSGSGTVATTITYIEPGVIVNGGSGTFTVTVGSGGSSCEGGGVDSLDNSDGFSDSYLGVGCGDLLPEGMLGRFTTTLNSNCLITISSISFDFLKTASGSVDFVVFADNSGSLGLEITRVPLSLSVGTGSADISFISPPITLLTGTSSFFAGFEVTATSPPFFGLGLDSGGSGANSYVYGGCTGLTSLASGAGGDWVLEIGLEGTP